MVLKFKFTNVIIKEMEKKRNTMKKKYIFVFGFIVIIIIVLIGNYYSYKAKYTEIKKYNLQYEYYYGKEVYGTDIATIINQAIDNNEKNQVEKKQVYQEENKLYFYVPNDTNSMKIDIKITDNNTIYEMESLYFGDIMKFVQNYDYIKFKCTKIEYNSNKKVNYMLFEQITNS